MTGNALDGRCDVVVSGTTPPARFWTLTLYDPDGRLVANSVNRYGFTSQEIVRRADGTFEIAIAPRARAGNWLPTGGIERYMLMLRLYDTPVGVATRTGREAPMPSIVHGALPMIRLLLWMLGGIAARRHRASRERAGAAAHRDPGRLFAARAASRRSTPSPRCRCRRPIRRVLPFMDPAFAVAVCRYDLSEAPLKFSTPVSQAYTSVSFYTATASPTTPSTTAPPAAA